MSSKSRNRSKLGLVVNPIAGMGGRVGLKGTDGEVALQMAVELGATRIASKRAGDTLKLVDLPGRLEVTTYGVPMGESEARGSGFEPTIVGKPAGKETTAQDTIDAARRIVEKGVDLLVFAGGDGTASDIYRGIDGRVPVLGIPSGVKMYSACFSIDPSAAAKIITKYLTDGLPVEEKEVLDVDEKAYREGHLQVKLRGYLSCPYEPSLSQASKQPTILDDELKSNQEAIAKYIVELMEPDTVYILGPGTTVRAIAERLKVSKTLLGVDLVLNRNLLAADVNEAEILSALDHHGKGVIIVSPLGNQGHVFGRGNQQLSPIVIQRVGLKNIIVLAAHKKLSGLRQLYVDTGDASLDSELKGYRKVMTDYMMEQMVRIA